LKASEQSRIIRRRIELNVIDFARLRVQATTNNALDLKNDTNSETLNTGKRKKEIKSHTKTSSGTLSKRK
jgi:hypothetical protein